MHKPLRRIALIAALFACPGLASAAELVMFEEHGCTWCIRWHSEVGVGYPHSAEGRKAPLRPVDIHGPRPSDLAFVRGVRASPTFVLVDRGHEIGRITGYPGADFFWGQLGQLLDRLPPQGAGQSATLCPRDGGPAPSRAAAC